MTKTAAALVIGNELLTGKIRDENVPFLGQELFRLGITLRRVVVCPDELETIVTDLNQLRRDHDAVFTSGGVGPTHDDLTLDAVAAAFGRRLTRSSDVEAMIRSYWGDRTTEGHLRMANMPEGAELIRSEEVPWPTVKIGNVYVLPGVPQIFRMKFRALEPSLSGGQPFFTHAVYTTCDEGELAALLHRLTREHPDVSIGSYPQWGNPECRLKLTFDGPSGAAVRAAADALVAELADDQVIRQESG